MADARHHHELLTTEAGGLILSFLVLLRPVAGAILDRVKKAGGRLTGAPPPPKG